MRVGGNKSSILTFKYPRSLSSLNLNFEEADSIDAELVPIFVSNIQRCHQLDSVALNLYNLEISETPIWTSLAEKVKAISLKKTLSNHEFEVSKNYLDSFQHLKTLENFSVDFNFDLSNQVLSGVFFAHLASLTNLKLLNLILSSRIDHPSFLNLFTATKTTFFNSQSTLFFSPGVSVLKGYNLSGKCRNNFFLKLSEKRKVSFVLE